MRQYVRPKPATKLAASGRATTWRPTAEDRKRLYDFEGYGADDPDIMFVGLEEYCSGDHQPQRDGIWRRCSHVAFDPPRGDKDNALEALRGLVKTNVGVWDMMARIVAGLTRREFAAERADLGSRPPRGPLTTLLTELRPLPRPGIGTFDGTYLEEWFDEFKSKRDYEDRSLEASTPRLVKRFSEGHPPRYAFFYGLPTGNWARTHLAGLLEGPLRPEEGGEIGRTTRGTVLAVTGFYDGQDASSAFRRDQVPALIKAVRSRANT